MCAQLYQLNILYYSVTPCQSLSQKTEGQPFNFIILCYLRIILIYDGLIFKLQKIWHTEMVA